MKVSRRQALKALASIAVLPVLPALPAPVPPPADVFDLAAIDRLNKIIRDNSIRPPDIYIIENIRIARLGSGKQIKWS